MWVTVNDYKDEVTLLQPRSFPGSFQPQSRLFSASIQALSSLNPGSFQPQSRLFLASIQALFSPNPGSFLRSLLSARRESKKAAG